MSKWLLRLLFELDHHDSLPFESEKEGLSVLVGLNYATLSAGQPHEVYITGKGKTFIEDVVNLVNKEDS